jgi:signal peptidase II
MMMRARLTAFGIAAMVLLLDRATKLLIQSSVPRWDARVVIPGIFNIVHIENRGAAFGMLAESASEWRAFVLVGLSLVVTAFVAALLWQSTAPSSRGGWSLKTALALIIGGAVGNLHDRLSQGAVTDFLQVFIGAYEWPAFNVADAAISIGAGLLLLDLIRHRRQPDGSRNAAQAH